MGGGDLHASSALSMAGQGQGLNLAQAVNALQSTLVDFQRRNEEAQRRTEESQAAMFHALNAIISTGNGDRQANGMAAQQALDVLRSQQVPQFAQQSLLPHASGSAQGKSGTQKQLLHLLQALQTNGNGQLSGDFAKQMLAGAEQAHCSPIDTSSAQRVGRRPVKQSNGHSSPTLGSYRPTYDYTHSNGVQSSPVAQQKKKQSATAAGRKLASQPYARNPLAAGSTSMNAQSPILGGLTPGYEADYLSGPSPTYNSGMNSGRDHHSASLPSFSSDTRPTNKENQRKPLACCYNCGETNEQYWQYLKLPSEAHIRFAVESTCMIDDVKNHRACNPCGTFFIENGGQSRPEFMWRESNGKRKSILRRAIEGARGDDRDDVEDARDALESSKRSAFARTLSEVCEIDAKRKTPVPSSSLKRTTKKVKSEAEGPSSEATEKGRGKGKDRANDDRSKSTAESEDDAPSSTRDRDRSRHRSPPKCVYDFSKARLRDFVMDPHGRWRTKRSILENPSGRKVGRPAGIKTGEGEGRQRNNPHKKVEALLQAYEEMDKAKLLASRHANNNAEADVPAPPMKRRSAAKSSTSVAKSDAPTGLENGQMMDALHAILSASSPVVGHAARETNNNDLFVHPTTQSRMPHSTPGLPSINKTPSGMGAVRYGAPAHLMNSSPATAFQTVMDEADTDWKALFGFGGKSHVGAAVRRSPRKKPVGTQAMVNPYATSIVSPSGLPRGAHAMTNQSGPVEASALMQMTSSSPLTRNRVKSGQFEWAWGSSDDIEGLTSGGVNLRNGKASSVMTSPASPSPRRPRNKNAKRKADAMLDAVGDSSSSQESVQRKGKQQKSTLANAAVLNAGPFMGLSSSDDGRADEEDADEEGPGSPTLGRSRRLGRKKNEGRLSSIADSNSQHNTPMALDLGLSSGMQASSSSGSESVMELPAEWARATTMGELFPNLSPDKRWNAASPSQALWNSPTSWALRMPTPSPVKAMMSAARDASSMKSNMTITGQAIDLASTALSGHGAKDGSQLPTPGTLLQVQDASSNSNKPSPKTLSGQTSSRRKPLPATVEDATPSDAIATPLEDGADDDDDDEDEDEVDVTAFQGAEGNALVFDMNNGGNVAELMKMFDDPYGFLAASGLSAQFTNSTSTASANNADVAQGGGGGGGGVANAAEQQQQDATAASIDGMPSSAELAQMDLFKDFDFTQQLAFFNDSSAAAAATASPNPVSRPLRTSPRKRNHQQQGQAASAVKLTI